MTIDHDRPTLVRVRKNPRTLHGTQNFQDSHQEERIVDITSPVSVRAQETDGLRPPSGVQSRVSLFLAVRLLHLLQHLQHLPCSRATVRRRPHARSGHAQQHHHPLVFSCTVVPRRPDPRLELLSRRRRRFSGKKLQ